jgi:outer membrane protein assembly factor BamB
MRTVLTGSLLITLMTFGLVEAADWPRFRGPNGAGQGQGDAIPVAWTDKDHNWKVKLPGSGSASPVVIGDRIFVTSAGPEKGQIIVQCLKASDGSTLWQRTYDSGDKHRYRYNSPVVSTPAADDKHLYVPLPTRQRYRVLAIDHAGKDKWQCDLPGLRTDHGAGGGSLIVHDGMVIVVCDHQEPNSYAAAFDCATGKVRWKVARKSGGEATYATPCIYQPRRGPAQLILSSLKCGMASLDPRTGKANWQLEGIYDKRCVGSVFAYTPDTGPHLLYGSCGGGGGAKPCTLVAVVPGNAADGTKPKLAYTLRNRNIPYVPTGVIKGDLLFLPDDSGIVTCARAATGQTLWRKGIRRSLYSSPVIVGDRIYFATRKGTMIVLAAADTYKLLGTTDLGEKCHATPAVAGGVMYIRTFTHLISVGGKK